MIGILYNGVAKETAENLAKNLNIIKLNENDLKLNEKLKNVEVLIRYGSQLEIDKSLIEINKRNSIYKAIDRISFAKILNDNNIKNPYIFKEDINKINYPIFVYTKNSYAGKGIVLCFSESDIKRLQDLGQNVVIFSKPIRIKRELRVHIINYSSKDFAFLVFEKELNEINPFCFVIRNKAITNWKFKYIGDINFGIFDKYTYKAIEIAHKTTVALGLDFAGIDIAIDDNNEIYVFDCNSAPGLGKIGLNFYCEYLKILIKNKIKDKISKLHKILNTL